MLRRTLHSGNGRRGHGYSPLKVCKVLKTNTLGPDFGLEVRSGWRLSQGAFASISMIVDGGNSTATGLLFAFKEMDGVGVDKGLGRLGVAFPPFAMRLRRMGHPAGGGRRSHPWR